MINGGPQTAASLTDLKLKQHLHQHVQQPQSSRLAKETSQTKKKQSNVAQTSGTILVQVGSQQLTEFQDKMRQQF